MATDDVIARMSSRKKSSVILPPLKLTTVHVNTNEINNSKLVGVSETRMITPYTPPSDNPNAILKNKLIRSISDKQYKASFVEEIRAQRTDE